ncbi:UNVERIFIED_CONTAM: hypothetical protein FKN15_064435 [Acipenser sinensis]
MKGGPRTTGCVGAADNWATCKPDAQSPLRAPQRPKQSRETTRDSPKPSPRQRILTVGRIGQGSNMHMPCTISGVQYTALVDTGATITLLIPGMLPL